MTGVDRIAKVLENTGEKRIAVFGDYALDKYLYIDPADDEPSVETGLAAHQVHKKAIHAGAGGTITNNLRALGAEVVSIGLVGEDGEGWELMRCLGAVGADISLMVSSAEVCTPTYTKPMSKRPGGYEESNRFDFRNFNPSPAALERALVGNLESCLPSVDAVIVIDQFPRRNLSAVTDNVRKQVCDLARRNPEKIFFVDSRAFSQEFSGMIVKCNNKEFLAEAFQAGGGEAEELAIMRRARMLRRRMGNNYYVTRGSDGIMGLFGEDVFSVPSVRVSGPVDITGAGDAASAGIVLGLSLGLSPKEAAMLGCCVASLTIQQIGVTGTTSVAEVARRLEIYQRGESV